MSGRPTQGVRRLLPLCRLKRWHSRKVNQHIVYFLWCSLTCLPLFNSIRNGKEAGGNMLQANASASSLEVIPRTKQMSNGSPLNPVWSSVFACRLLSCSFVPIYPFSSLLWHISSAFCSILCLSLCQVQGPLKVSCNQGTPASNQNSQGFWSMKSVCGLKLIFRGVGEMFHQVPWQSS